ncbi:MAG: PspC domain-containing protein [Candidatus Heimdallarchaeota archaeon]
MSDNTNYVREKELPYDKLKSNVDDKEETILFRSRNDYMYAGVIGGLANFWEMDSTTLRLIFLATSVLTGGLMLIVYFILIKTIPLAPEV